MERKFKYVICVIMLLNLLIIIPLLGMFIILLSDYIYLKINLKKIKIIGLIFSLIDLLSALIIFVLYDFSNNQFQFIKYEKDMNFFLGIDGISIYFILLTTLIMPIAILSN